MKMLPRLQAEESLQEVSEIAIGTGSLKVDERRRIMNEWLRLANQEKRRPALSIEQQRIILASMGVALECQKN